MKVGTITLFAALLLVLPLVAYAGGDPCAGQGGDTDGDGICDNVDNCPTVSNAGQSDVDTDGVGDVCDNCLVKANASQNDSDSDFCGNACDCDFNQDGICAIGDFSALSLWYLSPIPPAPPELDCTEPPDNLVAIGDFSCISVNYLGAPGPSGTTPGTTACP